MKIKEIFSLKNIILTILLIIVALVSIFKLSIVASSVDTHKNSIEILDNKKMTVVKLTTAAVVSSTAISMIPGDASTPLANQIMGMTTYLLIITGIIYLEKVLLTLTGLITFKYLIPVACGLLIIYLFSKNEFFRIISFKLAAFGIIMFFVVPISIFISSWMEKNYQDTIDSTIAAAESINNTEEQAVESTESSENTRFL